MKHVSLVLRLIALFAITSVHAEEADIQTQADLLFGTLFSKDGKDLYAAELKYGSKDYVLVQLQEPRCTLIKVAGDDAKGTGDKFQLLVSVIKYRRWEHAQWTDWSNFDTSAATLEIALDNSGHFGSWAIIQEQKDGVWKTRSMSKAHQFSSNRDVLNQLLASAQITPTD